MVRSIYWILLQVEVTGYPLPELAWYHGDTKLLPSESVQIKWPSESKCELHLLDVSLAVLGSYSVEAFNGHGVLRTTASLNIGGWGCSVSSDHSDD